MTQIKFTVHGHAATRGSKVPVMIPKRGGGFVTDKSGRPIVRVRDSNKKSGGWMDLVGQVAKQHMTCEMITGPVRLTAKFYFVRPAGHYRTGRNSHLLKDGAPTRPITKTNGDLDKLTRAIKDGMTKIVWNDDSQVVEFGEGYGKYWGEGERVEITIETL